MAHGILLHDANDDVGVAVSDLKAGSEVGAVTLEGKFVANVKLVNNVPLGHKVALRNLAQGKDVIEYGHVIGMMSQAAAPGAHVHTHNLKTKRWQI